MNVQKQTNRKLIFALPNLEPKSYSHKCWSSGVTDALLAWLSQDGKGFQALTIEHLQERHPGGMINKCLKHLKWLLLTWRSSGCVSSLPYLSCYWESHLFLWFQPLPTPHDHRWQGYWLIGKLRAFPSGSAVFFTTTHQHSIPLLSLSLDSRDTWTPKNLSWHGVRNPSFPNREPWPQTWRC